MFFGLKSYKLLMVSALKWYFLTNNNLGAKAILSEFLKLSSFTAFFGFLI